MTVTIRVAGRLRLLVAVTCCAWLLVAFAMAPPALAHASLVASSPSELQILTDPPSVLLLVFDEDIEPALSSVAVTGPGRTPVRVGALSHARYDAAHLTALLSGRMPAGDYQVTWHTVSTDDGHPTAGGWTFRVLRAAVVAAPSIQSAARPRVPTDGGSHVVYAVARWLAFLGFAALVGASYFLVACWPRGRTRRGSRRFLWGSWWTLLASTAVMLGSYGAAVTGAPVSRLTDRSLLATGAGSRVGTVLTVRLGVLVVLAAVAVVAGRRGRRVIGPGRSGPLAVLAAGALLASTWAAISHSESSAHAGPLVVLDVVHLVATAVWLGGLVVLGFAILREADLDVARAAVSRFSTAAAWSVVVLVSTGCVQAWQRVGSMSALTDNDYALLLAVKVALVAMTLGLAGFARFRMVPRQPAQLGQLRRLVLVELGFGIAVLTVTSVLVNTEPARTAHAQLIAAERAARPVGQAAVRPAALRAGSLSGVVPYDAAVGTTGRGTIQVTVAPAAVGSTEIHLSVLDSANTPRPVEKLSVALRPTGALGQQPIPVAFTEISPGHYVSRGAWFPAAGSWQLGIALRLSGDAAAVAVAGIAVT